MYESFHRAGQFSSLLWMSEFKTHQAHAPGWSLRPCVENDFVLLDFASTK